MNSEPMNQFSNRPSSIIHHPLKLIKRAFLLIFVSAGLTAQNSDETYISYPSGKKVIFEGQIAPSYSVLQFGDSQSETGFSMDVIVNPKILLKMYQSQSRPVKTPSYMPHLTVRTSWRTPIYTLHSFLTISHHSNGQAGKTFKETTEEIDIEAGSFSTNYIHFGYSVSFVNAQRHTFGISYEHHPKKYEWFEIDEGIEKLYGRKRLHYTYHFSGKLLQLDMDYTRIIDRWELAKSVTPHIFSATAKTKLPFFKNSIWAFATYYQGQDYYNIYFTKKIRLFKTGIAVQTKLVKS